MYKKYINTFHKIYLWFKVEIGKKNLISDKSRFFFLSDVGCVLPNRHTFMMISYKHKHDSARGCFGGASVNSFTEDIFLLNK